MSSGTKYPRNVDELLSESDVWSPSYGDKRAKERGITWKILHDEILDTKRSTIQWCMDQHLISSFQRCPKCDGRMTLKKDNGSHPSSDVLIWSCRRQTNCVRCNSSKSIRTGSWFSKSNLTMAEILEITYSFSHDWQQLQLTHETGISGRTAVDWYQFSREVTTEILLNRSEKLGGEGKIVEIDESKFGKRKYHR